MGNCFSDENEEKQPLNRKKFKPTRKYNAEDRQAIVKIQSAWRAHDRKAQAFQRTVRMAIKRKEVARELLATEESYVESLGTIISLFRDPVVASFSGKPLADPDEARVIFHSSLDLIVHVNTQLLTSLRLAVEGAETGSALVLGDIFVQISRFLKVYVPYVKNYPDAHIAVQKLCKRKSRFTKFLDECKRDPRSKRLHLRDFLIMPVQRVPRYRMLLEQVLKYTWKEHADHKALTEALEKIKLLNTQINEAKRDAESMEKVLEIQESLEGKFEPLVAPTRRFISRHDISMPKNVSEGRLKRLSVQKGGVDPGALFIFNDAVVIARKSTSKRRRSRGESAMALLDDNEHMMHEATIDLISIGDLGLIEPGVAALGGLPVESGFMLGGFALFFESDAPSSPLARGAAAPVEGEKRAALVAAELDRVRKEAVAHQQAMEARIAGGVYVRPF